MGFSRVKHLEILCNNCTNNVFLYLDECARRVGYVHARVDAWAQRGMHRAAVSAASGCANCSSLESGQKWGGGLGDCNPFSVRALVSRTELARALARYARPIHLHLTHIRVRTHLSINSHHLAMVSFTKIADVLYKWARSTRSCGFTLTTGLVTSLPRIVYEFVSRCSTRWPSYIYQTYMRVRVPESVLGCLGTLTSVTTTTKPQ